MGNREWVSGPVDGQSAFLPCLPSIYRLPEDRLYKETEVSKLLDVVSPRCWGCSTVALKGGVHGCFEHS